MHQRTLARAIPHVTSGAPGDGDMSMRVLEVAISVLALLGAILLGLAH